MSSYELKSGSRSPPVTAGRSPTHRKRGKPLETLESPITFWAKSPTPQQRSLENFASVAGGIHIDHKLCKEYDVRPMEGSFYTVEAAYQALKHMYATVDTLTFALKAFQGFTSVGKWGSNPHDCKYMGNEIGMHANGVRLDKKAWKADELKAMRMILVARCKSDPRYKEMLMRSARERFDWLHLVPTETRAVSYWGGVLEMNEKTGKPMWHGYNMLGKIMRSVGEMLLRESNLVPVQPQIPVPAPISTLDPAPVPPITVPAAAATVMEKKAAEAKEPLYYYLKLTNLLPSTLTRYTCSDCKFPVFDCKDMRTIQTYYGTVTKEEPCQPAYHRLLTEEDLKMIYSIYGLMPPHYRCSETAGCARCTLCCHKHTRASGCQACVSHCHCAR